MASSGSGYDLFSSTFSPDGRIFQVEYAGKAVENAGTIVGIKSSNGIVLGVSKPLLHKMVVPSTCSYKRIHNIDVHTGMASTGFLPDARILVSRAIEEASDFEEQFGVKIPPKLLADRLGYYMHYFTLHGGLRPFGATVLMAGYDHDTKQPSLFMIEPNGSAFSYYGAAAGKGKQAAKTELEKLNLHTEPCTVREAVKHMSKIVTMLHNENRDNSGKPLEMEFSWICEESGWKHVGVPKDIIAEAIQSAKEELDADEDDDEEGDDEVAVGAMEEG